MKFVKGLVIFVLIVYFGISFYVLIQGDVLFSPASQNSVSFLKGLFGPTQVNPPKPDGYSNCPSSGDVKAYCAPNEICDSNLVIGSFCEPDPNNVEDKKQVCQNADWNALCDNGEDCLTKVISGVTVADCGDKDIDCSAPGSNCCPADGSGFNGGSKVCASDEKCNTNDAPAGYPTCVADDKKQKEGYRICSGRGSKSWYKIWCPTSGKCMHQPSGYPICYVKPQRDDKLPIPK